MTDLAAALLEHGIRLANYGPGEHYTTCPQCSHTRKGANQRKQCLSVKVDEDGGAVWKCHHCEWAGNVPSRRRDDGQPRQRRTVKPKPARRAPKANALHAWAEKRRISRETLEELGVYMTPGVFFPQLGKEAPAIVWPYLWRGELVNHKYRSANKEFRQDKDAAKTLYNVDSLRDNDTAVWVEGEVDVATVIDAGYPSVVSLPDGAPATLKDEPDPDDRRFEPLRTCENDIKGITKWILAGDMDGPGGNLMEELARRLGKENCWRVTWPEGCKDANEVAVKLGPDAVRKAIDEARPWPVAGIYHHEVGAIADWRLNWRQTVYPTGLAEFDRFAKLIQGAFVVITGIPGRGKSEFADWLVYRMNDQHRWRAAICSPENPIKPPFHQAKFAEKYVGKPVRAVNHFGVMTAGMSDDELLEAERWIDRSMVFLATNEEENLTIDWILDRFKVAIRRYGVRLLVVDPWNQIEHSRPRGMSETEYVGEVLKKIRRFTQRYDVLFIMVAHPKKLEQRKDGSDPIPGLWDISGSAEWSNMADYGFSVHRPFYGTGTAEERALVEIYIKKVRWKELGHAGVAKLRWDRASGRYSAAPGSDRPDDDGAEQMDFYG